jgi:hypothetical protein
LDQFMVFGHAAARTVTGFVGYRKTPVCPSE